VVVALAVSAAPAGAAPPADVSVVRSLRAAMRADLRHDPELPGEALAVDAPGLHVALAVGDADVDARTPLTPDTPFRIASVTKTFVAAAILRLVEEHRIALDDPIAADLSPETVALLTDGGYDPQRITVRQLLQHTSGLYDYASGDAYDEINTSDPTHVWTPREQLQFAMDHGKPVGAPGEKYHYSDTGYVLLGEILQRVTGDTLPGAVRDLLHFDRLGLSDTWWEKLEQPPPGQRPRAHQYYDDFDNIALDASHDLYGGGGLVSTVADLATFERALFTGQVFDDPATLATMTAESGPGTHDGAGMGIFAFEVAAERCYSHPGYWGTDSGYCPGLDLAFARTINQADDAGFDYGRLDRAVIRAARRAHPAG
jgi:D-alanyl-D-alanine carboxypeptidase